MSTGALIAHGANVSAISGAGLTPLHLAAGEGHRRVVRRLVEAGAQIDICDTSWSEATPLCSAARWGRTPTVALLIRLGADVRATANRTQATALRFAAANGHVKIAEALIEAGADVNAASGHRTPLDEAASARHRAMVELLRLHGARGVLPPDEEPSADGGD